MKQANCQRRLSAIDILLVEPRAVSPLEELLRKHGAVFAIVRSVDDSLRLLRSNGPLPSLLIAAEAVSLPDRQRLISAVRRQLEIPACVLPAILLTRRPGTTRNVEAAAQYQAMVASSALEPQLVGTMLRVCVDAENQKRRGVAAL